VLTNVVTAKPALRKGGKPAPVAVARPKKLAVASGSNSDEWEEF